MHREKNIYKPLHIMRYILLLIAVLGCVFFSHMPAYADSMPGGNVADPVVRAVDQAKPAVVRIITTLNAQLTVHFSDGTSATFPQTSQTNNYPVQLSGTGTFITSQGDILTADHVVNPPKDQSLDQSLYADASKDVADYMNQHAASGAAQVTPDGVTQQLTGGQLTSQTTYATPSSTAFLSTDYTGPLTATDFNALPAGIALPVDHIEKESPPDQQDTAIIHVQMTDSPSVALGNSADVHQLDTLTIIGFPGNADVNIKPTDLLTSSVNTITVSSMKTTTGGAPLIQVGGNVEHGDSGGPALDNKGNVVGIVSFGATSGQTSFLQASSSAQTMLSGLNLDTKPGKFQQLWSQAFTDYAATTPGHWHQTQQELSQLATSYPLFQAVQPYLTYAKSQAKNEQATTPTAQTPTPVATATTTVSTHTGQHRSSAPAAAPVSFGAIALTVGALLLLLVLVGGLFAVSFRQRKKTKKTQPKNEPPPTEGKTNLPGASSTSMAPVKPVTPVPTTVAPASPQDNTQNTMPLKVWPCGHMNRLNARFCSVCGELAPD